MPRDIKATALLILALAAATSAAAATATATCGATVENKTGYGGANIYSIANVSSFADCCAACAPPLCVAWTFLGDQPDPAAPFLTQYLEVEVSPQNTLYVARISNPYGNGTDKTNAMVDCAASGIEHSTRMGHNSFNANLTVPWKNVYQDGKGPGGTKKGQTFYGNFFRVLMEQPVASCDPSTCDYGAWSPTFATPPQFHITTVFGEITMA